MPIEIESDKERGEKKGREKEGGKRGEVRERRGAEK